MDLSKSAKSTAKTKGKKTHWIIIGLAIFFVLLFFILAGSYFGLRAWRSSQIKQANEEMSSVTTYLKKVDKWSLDFKDKLDNTKDKWAPVSEKEAVLMASDFQKLANEIDENIDNLEEANSRLNKASFLSGDNPDLKKAKAKYEKLDNGLQAANSIMKDYKTVVNQISDYIGISKKYNKANSAFLIQWFTILFTWNRNTSTQKQTRNLAENVFKTAPAYQEALKNLKKYTVKLQGSMKLSDNQAGIKTLTYKIDTASLLMACKSAYESGNGTIADAKWRAFVKKMDKVPEQKTTSALFLKWYDGYLKPKVKKITIAVQDSK